MAFDRFMIAPVSTGLEKDVSPWLLPEDAFTSMEEAYIYQGRVVKRCGSMFMVPDPLKSRLAVLLGTTDPATGNLSGTVPGSLFKVGQMFSIDTALYTVYQTGTPAAMYQTVATTTATFNTTTGAYVFVGAPLNKDVYWYPAEPVMGIEIYEKGAINDQPTFAWDTQFVYKFLSGNRWLRQTTGTPLWHGDVNDFFWATTWQGATPASQIFFSTNFNVTPSGAPAAGDDPIWKYDGTTWATFKPQFLTAGNVVQGARIIVAFKNRLLLMNIVESDAAVATNTPYVSRCRFSWVGDPTNASAWLEPGQVNAGGGGFTDAPTEEQIISAEFIKDRLIVYFEQSTWELVYTNNFVEPFVWQKINTELGCNTTFSTVPFDKSVLAIGTNGVNACNGSNVERIDQKIPLEVVKFNQATNATFHVHGIRDYEKELVYWTFVTNDRGADPYLANRVLVYNYRNNTWSFFNDIFTCFGYFEQAEALRWDTSLFPWVSADFTWNDYESASHTKRVLAGTPNGYVVNIMPERAQNESSMQITDLEQVALLTGVTIINHGLRAFEDYIYITDCQGTTAPNGNIYEVLLIVDDNTVAIDGLTLGTAYTGGGRAARVSRISFKTKMLNPYVKQGRDVYLSHITCCVQKTSNGQISVEGYPSSTELSVNFDDAVPGVVLGTGVLETSPYASIPLEAQQTRLWHPVYIQTEGEFVQMRFYLDNVQMLVPNIAFADFELEGIILHTMPTSSRLQ